MSPVTRHVCPREAAHAAIGGRSLVRQAATGASRRDDRADGHAVRPRPPVIAGPLHATGGHGRGITDRDCAPCGRGTDVRAPDVFRSTHRFDDTRRDLP